jgi:thiol-disulfide isomerase/thioredoxin
LNGRLRGTLREFRTEIRWTIVVVVLAVLAIIALWPRGASPNTSPDAMSQFEPAQPPAVNQSVDPALRAAAGLQRCPASAGATADPALSGASGTCLADGSATNLAAAVAGRPTVINVWATWCAPCRTELPALQAYSEQPGAVRVLGVQVQSDQSGGLTLLRQLGVRFPAIWDGDGRIAAALRVPNALPASFVITASGEVRRVDPPVVFSSADEVRAIVQRTLGDGR